MYWRPNVDSSKMENLLNTQGVSLKEVLMEDGVINEVQIFNEKLLNFLITPNHISEMLHILISKPQPNEDGVLYFGVQNVVSEILSSYVNVIYSTLSSSPDYLYILFKPFIGADPCGGDQTTEPVNSVTCSLIFKVAKVLSQQSGEKLLNFLMSANGILDQFVKNIECNSVAEFLIKCIQSFQPNDVLINYLKWLSNEDITGKLLSQIDQNNDSQVCLKSTQCLTELLSAVKSSKVENPLILDLQSTRVVTHILSMMLTASTSSMSVIGSGLEFIKSMFEIPEKQNFSSFTTPIYQNFKKISINSQDISENPNMYIPIIDCILLHFSHFKLILEDISELSKIRIPTAYGGEIIGPLGPHRLAVIDLIHHFVLLDQSKIYSEIINSQIITTLLNLFFEYHLNTFLHRFVTEIVIKLITYGSRFYKSSESVEFDNIGDKIIIELFVSQDLLSKIVLTWSNNMSSVHGTSMMIRNTHRPFLKEIANAIEKQIENFSHILNADTLNLWKNFTETNLAEENKKSSMRKKNILSYPDSSSEGEGTIEALEDIDSEDTYKIYEDCLQQDMTYPFQDYNYKPIFVTEKSSMDSELISNPLAEFYLSTQEDLENAENFEAVCNVMLATRMPYDMYIEPNECINANDLELTMHTDIENIEEIYESNYKSCGVQTNVIDNIFREAYKDLNQSPKHQEIKILDGRLSNNHIKDTINNRFLFRTSTGLPIINDQKGFWNPNHSKVEKIGDNIIVGSTIVPRLKFGDINEKHNEPRSVFISNHDVRPPSDDKETHRGSPFCMDDEDLEDEVPLSSTARYIRSEKPSEYSDESDDDEDIPLSSRLEKGQRKLSENLSQLDNSLDDKTWNNPSNNQPVSSDDIELEFDTVQDVTPDLVITHCNSLLSPKIINNSDKEDSPEQSIPVSVETCAHSLDESSHKIGEPQSNTSVTNIDVLAIESPFSPKLIRHSFHNYDKETGNNKSRLFESSKCLTLSSNNKSNNIVNFKSNSGLTSRHTFSSILCPLPWTSFQKVNRSISAPTKINANNDALNPTITENTKTQTFVNGIDESIIENQNPCD